MQAFFPRIDVAAYRQQQHDIAEQLKKHPAPRAVTPPPKRAVGRPKLKRSVEAVLATAAAADTLDLQVPDCKRGKYTRWFNSPWINDILHAHVKNGGSARGTVEYLKKHAPDDRYQNLSHTTAASKLPDDWEEQGIRMAQRMGATMQLHKVHPSLVINMDQTGVHLVSTSSWTYEMVGSSDVAVIGAEDKRQITACVAASTSSACRQTVPASSSWQMWRCSVRSRAASRKASATGQQLPLPSKFVQAK